MDFFKVQVIIPALNEEQTLPGVLAGLARIGLQKIRVVDNGSRDKTAEVARNSGAEVIQESRRGYGQACWTGCENLEPEIEWILFCDADGSDALEELDQLFHLTASYDFILGDRRAKPLGRQAMTPVQNFGNGLATTLIRWGWGGVYHDLGPMRLIRREAYERIAMKDRGFGWTVEMQVRAVEENLRTVEVPVSYHPRKGGHSKISGTIRGSFKAGSIILATLLELYLKRLAGMPGIVTALLAGFLILLGSALMNPHGDFRVAGEVPHFLWAAAVTVLGFILSWRLKAIGLVLFWVVAVSARSLLLPMYPGDDVWRYLWEGWVQTQGFNPHLFSPNSEVLAPLRTLWWENINHRDITAIYPPLTQLGFRLLAFLGPSVLLFKLSFVVADLLVCWLLARRFGAFKATLYAWNPLVLYSFAGGAHYDSWMLLAVTLGWLIWEKKKRSDPISGWIAAFCFGCGIALKYVCAPLLGWLLWQIFKTRGWRSALLAAGIGALPFLISYLLLPGSFELQTLVPRDFAVYARSAEFVPYYVGEMWEASKRMNPIFLIPAGLLVAWRLIAAKRLEGFAEEFWLILLVFSPIVHFWYFTWALPFVVATRNLGWRLLAVSGFIYFALQHRVSIGPLEWKLTVTERLLLWLPLILGFFWWRYRQRLDSVPEKKTDFS